MKICIVTSSYPINSCDGKAAAGLFVKDFSLELFKAGNQVFILTQARQGVIEDDAKLKVVRFPWFKEDRPLSRLNPANPLDLIKILTLIKKGERRLVDLISNEKINLCLAMWAVPAGYLAYLAHKRLKTPYAVWVLGSDIWGYGNNLLFRPILKKILDNAYRLFADGYKLSEDVERLSKNKCAFLSSARWAHNSGPKPPLSNIDKAKTNFLFIGRYHKNKGVDILIESINMMPRDLLAQMNFYIFGGGNLENPIKVKVKKYKLDKYVFIGGFIDSEMAISYLTLCDCVIIPSRIESIPLILSDSLQAGTPLIVADVGDMGKLVREYGAGKVIAPENPKELKDAIIEFAKEDKRQYSQGINELKKVFDIRGNVNKFLRIISN